MEVAGHGGLPGIGSREPRGRRGSEPRSARGRPKDRCVRRFARSFGLVVVASTALAAAAYPVWRGLDAALGRSFGGQVVSVFAALAAGGLVYLVSCRLLRVRELEALLSLRARLRRA